MTHTEIEALKPGRTMDATVAEQVMGWEWWSDGKIRWLVHPTRAKAKRLRLPEWNESHPQVESWKGIRRGKPSDDIAHDAWTPHYSTDIAAAWEVAEVIRAKLFSIRKRFLDSLQEQTLHTVKGTGEIVVIAWPDVFWSVTPEAICKAALMAVGDGR